MSSTLDIPAVPDFLTAYSDAIVTAGNNRTDTRRGSGYDLIGGGAAVIWTREAQRDDDLFRDIYFDTATGSAFDTYALQRFGQTRATDTRGVGVAFVGRTSTSGGAGTIWEGTRLSVISPDGKRTTQYRVTDNTDFTSTQKSAICPVEATFTGPSSMVDTGLDISLRVRFDDPVWDTSIVASSLRCAAGTDFEDAAQFKARIRSNQLTSRPGYQAAIVSACEAVGAVFIVIFDGSGTVDRLEGEPVIFVADAGFASPDSLVQACRGALEDVRILGTALEVRKIQLGLPLSFNITVNLWDKPSRFNLTDLQTIIAGSIQSYFLSSSRGYYYSLSEIEGYIRRASGAIQAITFNSPTSDVTIFSGSPPFPPAVLTKQDYRPERLQVSFQGPIL